MTTNFYPCYQCEFLNLDKCEKDGRELKTIEQKNKGCENYLRVEDDNSPGLGFDDWYDFEKYFGIN